MATRIQSLFLVEGAFTVANNEHFSESIAFYDPAGNPIPLDGIEFTAAARANRASNAAFVGFATAGSFLDLPTSVPRGLILTSGNVLSFYAPFRDMPRRPLPGAYLLDALASADGLSKRVFDGSLTVIQGLTP